ncbi:hypothetical protein G6015_04335, partial [Dietzia sp. SLG510A3-40A3]|nr:hypothetical protein [Dietzia sp. SLG510A3-40A3]
MTGPRTSIPAVDDDTLARLLTDWLPEQRWFAGKGLELAGVRISRREVFLDDPEVLVEHLLVDVEVDGRPQRYQVPIATAAELPGDRRTFPLTPEGASPVVYDGLRDPRSTESLLRHLAGQDEVGGLRFRLVPGATLPGPTWGRLLEGEQSNSSLVFGDDLMVKVFRLVQPGVNPDVELHAALAERECPAVAALRGWVELDDDTVGDTGAGPTTLAMAQEFMAGAADGWAMATASVRDLFAEADLLAEEVGTDFADESFRLGAAVAQVHEDLAAATGV